MPIIGIDLGTSNSAAAVLRGGRPVMIPSAEGLTLGGKAFPSYVAIATDGQMLVGEPARRQAAANPEGTASAFKRRMGLREMTRLRDREFSPEQLSAFLLQKVKRDAEAFPGEPVKKAVITVFKPLSSALPPLAQIHNPPRNRGDSTPAHGRPVGARSFRFHSSVTSPGGSARWERTSAMQPLRIVLSLLASAMQLSPRGLNFASSPWCCTRVLAAR
ncbi:MAG: Hsp70 family protein [Rhodospirillales bacterium]|nr:Hsp70 family protein [Rhodospirillales bacterium]MDH3912251.1 Hsp70 family protein [Rhodospirillales bacterium]MDH3969369.1 Hsp70 family protein [Rhodospirillales bacterium]